MGARKSGLMYLSVILYLREVMNGGVVLPISIFKG